MKFFTAVLLAILFGGTAAHADKITRSVGSDGVTKISIQGDRPNKAPDPVVPSTESKPFQVYELESPALSTESAPTPVVIVVSSPPPIAPNPAAHSYDYRYGYGYNYAGYGYNYAYPGYGYGYNYPGYGRPRTRVCPPSSPRGSQYRPTNYQNRPTNYQNRPVNYQNRPTNYQPRPSQRPWR